MRPPGLFCVYGRKGRSGRELPTLSADPAREGAGTTGNAGARRPALRPGPWGSGKSVGSGAVLQAVEVGALEPGEVLLQLRLGGAGGLGLAGGAGVAVGGVGAVGGHVTPTQGSLGMDLIRDSGAGGGR